MKSLTKSQFIATPATATALSLGWASVAYYIDIEYKSIVKFLVGASGDQYVQTRKSYASVKGQAIEQSTKQKRTFAYAVKRIQKMAM
jgi:hypothetical protein